MADEELTEQERMDRMVAELSADIEDINKEGKEDEPEQEKTPVAEEEARGEGPKGPESEGEESEEPGADEKEDRSDATTTEKGKEEKEKDLEETTSQKKALPDKPATENLAIGTDLYQEESDADEQAGDEESDENIDALDQYEHPDIREDDHKAKRRRSAIVWSVIAILVLGSSFVWFVYYKDVNILEHPILSRWVQKLKPRPAVKDTKDLEPQQAESPATGSHVKAPQTSVSSSLAEMTPDHLTKSEMFKQKIEQILAVRDKLSEKRTQAALIREKLNEQILALKKEILAEQGESRIASYEEAVKSPRIYYNIKLIRQLKAYTSKLAERIRYYEDGYDKMGFRYQEADDNFKMIELWSDTKTKRLMAKIDKAMNEYLSLNKPHMFTNKQIVLDNPRKIWTEVMQPAIQSRRAGPKSFMICTVKFLDIFKNLKCNIAEVLLLETKEFECALFKFTH